MTLPLHALALPHPALLALAITLAGDDPRYPLGEHRTPPMIEPATPLRLVDLRYRYEDAADNTSAFEARVRAGASSFVGGELTHDRRSIFHDTTRTEIGLTEQDGDYTVEGSVRLKRFATVARAEETADSWEVAFSGGFRVSPDLELIVSLGEDLDGSAFDETGAFETFVETGELPPGRPPSRELNSRGLAVVYQRGARFDISGAVERARVRSEAGFDFDRTRVGVETIWNLAPMELSAGASYERRDGRLEQKLGDVFIDADVRLAPRLVATAGTHQRWEPGALRFEESYRAGASWFARPHRFAREAETARLVQELTSRAFALGYNERRRYDVDELRALRERLGISRHRQELAPLIDALYRAQVEERNVPLLGFEYRSRDDKQLGVETERFDILAALPWSFRSDPVDFVTVRFRHQEDTFSGGVKRVSRSLAATVELNREIRVTLEWMKPGPSPLDIVLERDPGERISVGFDYTLGR